MPGLLMPDGSYHDSSAPAEPVEAVASEQEVMGQLDAALEDARAALEGGEAEAPEPEITPCRTAFTVYLMDDGDVLFGATAWADPQPERKPTFDEMSFGAAVIKWHFENYAYRVAGGITEGCVTAFTPYLTHDGRWLISAEPNDALVIDREPSEDEVVGGLAVVMRDVATQETLQPLFNQFAQALVQSITQSVITNMVNIGRQAQEAQQAMQVAEKLEKDKQRRAGGR